MDILTSLNRRQGLTVIIVTHEPEVAAYANRVLTLRDGQLISDGRPSKSAALAQQAPEMIL